MYQQLYDILSEAIYGAGTTLDNYQEFVLTQISTYMSYGVTLIPVIAIIGTVILQGSTLSNAL